MDDPKEECQVCGAVRRAARCPDSTIVVRLSGDHLTEQFLSRGDYVLARGCSAGDFVSLLEFLFPLLAQVFPPGALQVYIGGGSVQDDRVLLDGDQVVVRSSRVPVLCVY